MALLSAASVCVMISIGIYGYSWQRLEEAILDNIHTSASSIIILLLIGAIAGTWMVSGMLASITDIFLRCVHRVGSVVASTVGAGIFFNICTADQYISIILTGNLFKDLYHRRGLEARLLSRSVEDSATVCSVLIPWNSCGMTQATVLGVPTFAYLPYCIFNLVSPLMSIVISSIGYRVVRSAGGNSQQ